MRETLTIRTEDGDCPTHLFTPETGAGPWPAILVMMDGLGIRPALLDMGQRLADAGYIVLLPDLFYRAGPYGPFDPKEIFGTPDGFARIGPLFASTDPARAAQDAAAFFAYLDTRADVRGSAVGTTGYCMGGAIALTLAATYPDRVAAAASFHGGNLASDQPDSPHLLVPKIKGRIYIGEAVNDPYYPPDMAARLKQALLQAGVDHACETYGGALHGWTMKDFPVYDHAAGERHWRSLLTLFDDMLR